MKMSLFKVTLERELKESLLMALADEGMVHIKSKKAETIKESLEKEAKHKEEIEDLKENLRDLFKELKIDPSDFQSLELTEDDKREFNVKDLYELIHYLGEEINYYMNRINELERYINQATIELENMNYIKHTYKFLEKYNLTRTNLQKLDQFELKAYTTFSKNLSNIKELFQFAEFPNLYQYKEIPEDRICFFIIYPKEREDDLKERIDIVHGEEIPILKKYLKYDGINFERIERELESIKKTMKKYEKELNRLRNENLLKFAAIREVVNNLEEYNWAENQFSKYAADKLSIQFFVPSESAEEIQKSLKSKYQSINIYKTDIRKKENIPEEKDRWEKARKISPQTGEEGEEKEEEGEEKREDIRKETPTKIKHNKIIRPFETLTRMYGIPSYAEIDPTPFLFITFPLLFAMMFGDIGHGIVLIIAGITGGLLFRKKNETLKNISWIIFYCGCWAILFGTLYGEFFGSDHFFGISLEPIDLWLPGFGWITVHQPLNNVLGLLWLAIFIGIAHINLGMVIEFSNYIMQRKIYQAVADPLMKILFLDFLVYLVLYWGLDIMVWLSPPYPILLPLIPGLFLIILKPLGKLFGISYLEEESYSELLSEGSIETFETILSIPSNILSYLRLLALALAHISLMLAIERIAQLLTGGDILTQILIVVVLIFGNTIIIVLEGIIAFINALRLNFYEFFFKFYEGVGTEFDPFTLKNEFSKIEFKPEIEKDVISEEIEKEIETKKAKEFIDEAKSYIEKKYLK